MLIIFDCDGVLVDSEMIASRELAAYITDLGRPTRGEDCRAAFTGLSLQTVATRAQKMWGVDFPDDFVTQLQRRDAAAFERELAPIPGVETLLDALNHARLPYCIASSGRPEKIRHSLTITGLLHRFDDHLFSAAQVPNGKPAPDLFLYAAAQMGVEPQACVVIEDSPAGVAGAVAAGMRVIGFTGGGHCGPGYADTLKDAEVICNTMSAVEKQLLA